jgi:selenocysteine-specific elongation factor
MALMVVDIQKGIQTQTAEGLVIAQVTVEEMVVVINKIDVIPAETRNQRIERARTGLKKAFSATRFSSAEMVPYSAKVGYRRRRI